MNAEDIAEDIIGDFAIVASKTPFQQESDLGAETEDEEEDNECQILTLLVSAEEVHHIIDKWVQLLFQVFILLSLYKEGKTL